MTCRFSRYTKRTAPITHRPRAQALRAMSREDRHFWQLWHQRHAPGGEGSPA